MPPSRLAVAFGVTGLLLAGGLSVLGVRGLQQEPVRVVLPSGTPTGDLRVYVSGAVAVPGVYALGAGDRVEDALQAAGGPNADADLERVNLAARLHDGDQVVVPVRSAAAGTAASGATAPVARVNLNTASQAELDKLPGIGAVRARRILESRQQDGPFADAYELVERRIVTVAVYQRLRDLVAVR